ncbi:MAG TPA: hypothetical protein VG457_12990 [Planctomycetota bacterium]|jgi:hypothetical protein|nr:hypothetical protein [Planctomycetota bacterium]
MKTMAAILILAVPCLADEVVMKDGRRIPWKSVADDGENYTIEGRDGKKITVKKVDVDHFNAPSDDPIAAPLTGAGVEGPKKALAPIDILLKAKVGGDWKYAGRSLVATVTGPSRSVVSFDSDSVPEEYDLTVTIERLDAEKQDFLVGLIVGTHACCFHFDSYDGTKGMLTLIGLREHIEYGEGGVFKKGRARTVKFMVRKTNLEVLLDGKKYLKTKAIDWNEASIPAKTNVPDMRKPFLAATSGSWRVSAISIAPLAAQ